MARLAVAHTRAVTKGPPHCREGWKIRVGSFDSPPLTNGIGKLLYPTVNQDGEVIGGLVAIPETAVQSSVQMGRHPGAMRIPPRKRMGQSARYPGSEASF